MICILGSSPNEWIAARELVNAGRQVRLYDRTGGALHTEEFYPGFFGEAGLDSVRVDPRLAKVVTLEHEGRTGLQLDGSFTRLTRDSLPGKFVSLLDDASEVLRSGVEHWRGLGARQSYETLRLPFMSLKDFLNEWFEDPALKGLLAGVALRGINQGPFAGGTTWRLIEQWAAGEALTRTTVAGGLARLTEQLRDPRVEVVQGFPPLPEVDGDRVLGAEHYLSGMDARQTYTQWLRPRQLETEWTQALRHYRFNGCVARMNLAIKGLPRLHCPELRDVLVLQPDMVGLERIHDESKYGRAAREPWVELTIPSLLDPSLAPEGHHVVSLWIQYAPFKSGVSLEQEALALLRRFWPELDSQLLGSVYRGPRELAEHLGLTEGHLFGGERTLDQSLFLRPAAGFAGLDQPLANLDLCGSGAAPGGYTGWSGYAAARRLLDAGSV